MPVAEEGGEEGEGEGEEEPSEEGDGSCEEYAECCSDYVDALADMAGMEGAAEAAEQSCSAISAMDELPGGSDACRQALDGMKQAMAAYRSMPGFSVPSSCQ